MTRSSSLVMRKQCFIEPRARRSVGEYEFLSLKRKYKKQWWLEALKIASKIVVHKTGEFLENKIADAVAKSNYDKIVKPKHVMDDNPRNVEEIIIPPEKGEEYETN